MNQELPGRTDNDQLGTGNNRDCTGNNRDGTFRAPVYLCNVAIKGLCRHSPGLHWGVAVGIGCCHLIWKHVHVCVTHGFVYLFQYAQRLQRNLFTPYALSEAHRT
ncbi:hypothetical protein DPMN_006373 [Dreissena polymorpha]|uniref:Uncharacterized protein n=1 Tax=Dreissena polymorpha TaxID=45954 RepID=A0A9D4RVB7_DREPO|nr:hypothetical protein DPMN_006373 [Dreissena polymorpha]